MQTGLAEAAGDSEMQCLSFGQHMPLGLDASLSEQRNTLASPIKADQAGTKAALPTSPVPEKLQELQMEAVQSLLGLSSVCGGGGQSAWAHWEHSGRSREDTVVRKKLAGGDVAKARLRVPAPLYELLFGHSPKVVLQAATTNVGHFVTATGLGRRGYLLQGGAVQQLLADLGGELGDVLVFSCKGATAEGTPIALCTLAKTEASGKSSAGAAPAAAARAATCSAAGSPTSPSGLTLPADATPSPYGVTPSPATAMGGGCHLEWTSDDDDGEEAVVRGRAARHGEGAAPLAPCTISAAEGGGGAGQVGSGGTPQARAGAKRSTAPESAGRRRWTTTQRLRRRHSRRQLMTAKGDAGELSCTHCGTSDTPRWWKDNFPMGTLCNACGIWLKRHGYPRPVQFFVQPGSNGAGPRPKASGRRDDGPSGASSSRLVEASPPPDVEFYLINGRPKRRRTAQGSAQQLAPSSSNADAGGVRLEAAQSELLQAASDPGINFEAAGGKVFVVRRKLIKGEDGGTPIAALVHFGWAPLSRAAHEMYNKVVQYSERSSDVTVDDYELLTDCKATAQLHLRPGRSIPSWDGLVREFVESL